MQGTKVALVPLPLLSKPAEDAAAVGSCSRFEAADATAETEDVADVTRELAKRWLRPRPRRRVLHGRRRGYRRGVQCRRRDGSGRYIAVSTSMRCGDATYTLETALQALAAQGDERRRHLPEEARGLSSPTASMRPKWETRQFIGGDARRLDAGGALARLRQRLGRRKRVQRDRAASSG